MLSTTVEPECRQRPFVMWSPITKALAHATIHPATDHVDGYGSTAPANSAAVH
jgi:hypothetical protein